MVSGFIPGCELQSEMISIDRQGIRGSVPRYIQTWLLWITDDKKRGKMTEGLERTHDVRGFTL